MFAIIEGLKNIWHARTASIVVSFLIGAALLTGGCFFLLTVKLQETSHFVEQALEIEVFLNDGIERDSVDSLKTHLESFPETASVSFISKDSAAAIFRQEVGEEITTITGENPLPSSFRINVKLETLLQGKLDSLTAGISGLTGVDDVFARRKYLLSLMQYRQAVWIIHIGAGTAFFAAALFFIINVIKLSIRSRRKSIEIMKLIGATRRFISAPYVIEGMIVGILGGAIGCILSWSLLSWLEFLLDIRIALNPYFYPILFMAGCLTGTAGSVIAVRRFIRNA